MTYVLGVNLSHDRSACLVRDGEIVVAIEEERLDRIKHSEGFIVRGHFERLSKVIPMKAITYCLSAAGIGLDDLDLVVGNRPLNDGAVARLGAELPLRDPSRIHSLPMPSHHLAHAAAAYFGSPFEDAAVLVVDAVGSRIPGQRRIEQHSLYVGEGNGLRTVATETFPDDLQALSLGLFYNYFTARLGFVTRWGTPTFGDFQCGGYPEGGKTMGLAPYGQLRPDWGRLLKLEGFRVLAPLPEIEAAWERWTEAEGQEFAASGRTWDCQFAKDVARKVQDELEEAVLHLARQAAELTGRRRLCISGGVALNSVANQRVAVEGPFDDLYLLPPAGDAGIAIGCALYGYHVLAGGRRRSSLESAGLGRRYRAIEVDRALRAAGEQAVWREAGLDEVAQLVADHRVVGWFDGGSEMGPRALGHRSILADPRHPAMRDYLNQVVKHREVFRPFAPSVLEEHAADWFDLRGTSPFMLLVPTVLAGQRSLVPAITHVDGTARVQTVSPAVSPRYHELIAQFHRLTSVPLVLNTSFNDAGEPIVESPADAVRTFLHTELDHLYIEGLLVSKPGRELPPGHPARTPVRSSVPAMAGR